MSRVKHREPRVIESVKVFNDPVTDITMDILFVDTGHMMRMVLNEKSEAALLSLFGVTSLSGLIGKPCKALMDGSTFIIGLSVGSRAIIFDKEWT